MNKFLDLLTDDIHTVAIAGHVKPDGDCVGSTLGVYNYIKTYYPNIQPTVYLEPIPNIFKFLRYSEEIVSDFSDEKSYDLFLALDCGDERRLGEAAKYFKTAKKTVCIDHHVSNQSFADINDIQGDASSTCELVFQWMEEDKLTKEIAECLYTGMIHDTGVFQYSCTSSKTMNIAGKLMDQGIAYPDIVDKTFFEKTFEQNQILAIALLNATRVLDNRCIVSCVSLEEMARVNAQPKHLEGIVAQLRSTLGIDVAVFLYETGENTYKVSMRSNGVIDVAAIAVKYDGGGHVRAAGVTMEGTKDAILNKIIAEVSAQYEK